MSKPVGLGVVLMFGGAIALGALIGRVKLLGVDRQRRGVPFLIKTFYWCMSIGAPLFVIGLILYLTSR